MQNNGTRTTYAIYKEQPNLTLMKVRQPVVQPGCQPDHPQPQTQPRAEVNGAAALNAMEATSTAAQAGLTSLISAFSNFMY